MYDALADRQLLNALRTLRDEWIAKLAGTGHVYFEISMLEGVGRISGLLRHLSTDRLLFGSHVPLFCLESALLKLEESEQIPRELVDL